MFPDMKSWLAWLNKNHAQEEGVWIKFAKKNSGVKSITYEEGREGAIMYGWIDGLINSYDEQHYLTKFTMRRRRSKWSKINRDIAQDLITRRKIKPPGLAQIEAAKKDGRWEAAYDGAGRIEIPAELKRLIESNVTAKKNFENLDSTNRYAFLYRIQSSARQQTRQKHIDKAFTMLKTGEVYYPELLKKKTKAVKKKK